MNIDYEKEKIYAYVFNAVFNDIFLKDNFSCLCKYVVRVAENIDLESMHLYNDDCGYEDEDTIMESFEGVCEKKAEFEKLFKTNKQEAIRSLQNYAKEILNKRPLLSEDVGCFEQNLIYLQQILNLTSVEKEFLGFLIRIEKSKSYKRLRMGLEDDYDVFVLASIFFNEPLEKVYALNDKQNSLMQLSLMAPDFQGRIEATDLAKCFYYKKFNSKEEVEDFFVGKEAVATLKWSDFEHMEDASFVEKIVSGALKKQQKGVNILFYGEPGTGKTEFSKTLAKRIGARLFSVEGEDETKEDYENKDSTKARYAHLLCTQKLLENDKKAMILLDEADDIFYCSALSKIKINRLLENNKRPVIWIMNNVHFLDSAYMRRFTYIVKFKRPEKDTIYRIWRKNLKENKLDYDDATIERFTKKYSIPPSFVSCATKATQLMNGSIKETEHILDHLELAYSGEDKNACQKEADAQSDSFNLDLLNTDVDLDKLAKRIVSVNKLNFSLCLYGVSGTGKSAFAQYLGEKLQIPVIKKRCSDLLSKWVGDSEKKIAQAFQEAKQKKALLIFDEADSFLQNRENAQRSWEITQVNEMLTQMEQHQYPFVCTTNLMNYLDKAALRRFTFKVKYDYLTNEQLSLCFEHFFKMKDVDLSHLSLLTPGDFVVVKQKAEILDVLNDKDELIRMLEMEQQNKAPVSRRIGFL